MGRRDRDSKNTLKIVMSVFIAVTMILSVFGIIIGSSSTELKYGKFKFSQKDSVYTTKLGDNEVYFYTMPYDVAYINLSASSLAKIRGAAFIITTFDPTLANESIPAIELARFDLANFMKDKMLFNSVSKNTTGYEALPVMTCANATAGAPMLVFNISDTSGFAEEGECVYLNGRGVDFLRLRDRILYGYYGVIANETQ